MSKEVDKAAVLQRNKVRTKIREDKSWMQPRTETKPEAEEEKPWVAEVRASRVNGAPLETSPVSSPIQSSPSPVTTNTERSATSGFMIRGIFMKTEKPPTSTSNGYSGTTQFTKKPSETYKKIAPHTVRSTTENQEGQLSQEEQKKRTEAASNIVKKPEQRSYVLSAAKIYESPKTPDLLVSSTSFVAQRVEVTDEDDVNTKSAPSSTSTSSTVSTNTNVSPLLKPRATVNTSSSQVEVKEDIKTVEIKVKEKIPEPVQKEEVPKVTKKDPFEGMVPSCTKVATPLPELIPDLVQAVYVQPDHSSDAEKPESPVAEDAPPSALSETPVTPPTKSTTVESTVVVTEEIVKLEPEPKPKAQVEVKVELQPEPKVLQKSPEVKLVKKEETVVLQPEPKPEVKPQPSSNISSSDNTLTLLSDTLISFFTTSVKEEEPVQVEEQHTEDNSAEEEATPSVSNGEPLTDDLLGFNDSLHESVKPVPPSSGLLSQDLLSPINSEPVPAKPSSTVDLLSNDIILITETCSLNTQPKEKQPTDEAAKKTQSSVTEKVTITTQTVIITDNSEEESADPPSSHVITTVTESSSDDPFDPYPIGTTSSNSASDLLQPLVDISINRTSNTSVEIKNPSPETKLSTHTRSWTRTRDQPESTVESQEAEPEEDKDQQAVIMFEKKSKENDSPWDRWTSPTVYTVTTDEQEDEEEKPEMSESTETTITTITTIRETHSEPEPAMDRMTTPEPESKKPFVYVKEYVNTSEMSLLNATDRSEYLTSTSSSYSYSSPSTNLSGSLSSKCTYCGEPVGSDAKITIDHLNINCHPACFKCGTCSKPMGDLIHKMFLHRGKVHCESCYRNALE